MATAQLENMDSLPNLNSIDLSLASSFIPGDLFISIVSFITQIDLSLYGMNSHFDADNAAISPSVFSDFVQPAAPISSTASFAESIVVHSTDFA